MSLTCCEVQACTAPGTVRVRVQLPGWRVPESRMVCIEHARTAQTPTEPAPAGKEVAAVKVGAKASARVIDHLRSSPWSTGRQVVEALTGRERDSGIRKTLTQLAGAGQLEVLAPPAGMRTVAGSGLRYALPGTPLPMVEPIGQVEPVAETPADSVADSQWGVADPPTDVAQLTGYDTRAEIEGLRSALDAERQASERLRTALARVATHLMGGPPVRESADDVCAAAESRAALRRALVAELSPDGRLSDRELIDLLRQRLAASKSPDTQAMEAVRQALVGVQAPPFLDPADAIRALALDYDHAREAHAQRLESANRRVNTIRKGVHDALVTTSSLTDSELIEAVRQAVAARPVAGPVALATVDANLREIGEDTERDTLIGELNELRREREGLHARLTGLYAERAEIHELLGERACEDTLIGAVRELVQAGAAPESLYAGSPAADGRAVQALLDAHDYPLRELGPVVRVMRLLGQQGVDLAGDAGGKL